MALLAMVATAGVRGISRDYVLVFLWPELSARRGRNVLNQTLHALRRDLSRKTLFLPGRILRLNPDIITCDLWEFEAALSRRELAAAVELYRSPFLQGFTLGGSPEFERWVDSERDRLSQRYFQALATLATRASDKGDHRMAATWWRELITRDPLSSVGATGLITSLAAAGDRPSALAFARQYQALLRSELDVGTDPAMAELIARLEREPGATAPMLTASQMSRAVTDLSGFERFSDDAPRVSPAPFAMKSTKRRSPSPLRHDDAHPAEREDVYKRIVEASADIIYRCDLSGVFTYVNTAVEKFAGLPRSQIVGRSYLEFVREDFRPVLMELYTRQIAERIPTTYCEFAAISGKGIEVWIGQHVELITSAAGELEILAVGRDITMRKRLEQARDAVSIRDPDTGLLNAGGFQAVLEHRIASSKRTGRPFHIFFLRCERNASEDNEAASGSSRSFISATAQVLRSTFRDSDVLGRLGECEFGVVAIESDPQGGERLSARLHAALAELSAEGGAHVRVSVAFYDAAVAGTIEDVMDPEARRPG